MDDNRRESILAPLSDEADTLVRKMFILLANCSEWHRVGAFHDQLSVPYHCLECRCEVQFVHQDNVIDITRDDFLGTLAGALTAMPSAMDAPPAVSGNP